MGLARGARPPARRGSSTPTPSREEAFIPGGNNRVILATDGDFNVGISDADELIALVESRRDRGIFLTTVGVGLGNYREAQMEQIANHGNGTYEYVADLADIEKVFVHERSRFVTVTKDVKVQIEFDSTLVSAYRLIGYENRLLQTEDFEDDTKDAGEIGAGQSITALYEIIPTTRGRAASASAPSEAYAFDVRYKQPTGEASELIRTIVADRGTAFTQATQTHQFVAAVAAFALVARESAYVGDTDYSDVLRWLDGTGLPDPHGYHAELRTVVSRAR